MEQAPVFQTPIKCVPRPPLMLNCMLRFAFNDSVLAGTILSRSWLFAACTNRLRCRAQRNAEGNIEVGLRRASASRLNTLIRQGFDDYGTFPLTPRTLASIHHSAGNNESGLGLTEISYGFMSPGGQLWSPSGDVWPCRLSTRVIVCQLTSDPLAQTPLRRFSPRNILRSMPATPNLFGALDMPPFLTPDALRTPDQPAATSTQPNDRKVPARDGARTALTRVHRPSAC